MTWNALREPALIVSGVLAPTVQTLLLVWGRLSDEQQAVWNAVTVAVAGVVLAALAAKERLAPAILGLGSAVIALATFYGWHLSAAAETAVSSTLSLLVAAFLRTQITASVDEDGNRSDALPPPKEPKRTVAELVAANPSGSYPATGPPPAEPLTRPFQRIPPPGAAPPPRQPPPPPTPQRPANPMWYVEPAGPPPTEEGTGMRG